MIISDSEISDNPSVLAELPVDGAGYGEVTCNYRSLVLEIAFEYYCYTSNEGKIGNLCFDYCTSYLVIDQNHFSKMRPPKADCIYSLSPIFSADRVFPGFAIWFSNSRRTYVIYAQKFSVNLPV